MWLGGRGRSRGRGRAAGRVPARPVPGPAVLGPPVRGLRPLPADLARACSDGGRAPTMVRCLDAPLVTFAGARGRVVASGPTWLPLPCPRTESSRPPTGDGRRRQASPAEPTCDHRPTHRARRAPSATGSSAADQRPGHRRNARSSSCTTSRSATRTASSPCATSTWSSPKATSCSSSGRPAPASPR